MSRARARLRALALIVVGLALARHALASEAVKWLERAAAAARELNYVGTIVYQQGARTETSRLVHLLDATVEREKVVSLDGPPREVVRVDEEVTCYLPEARLVRIERRSGRNPFPALLPQQVETLTRYYTFRPGELTRIAGHEARAMVFEPADNLRHGVKLWAETGSGLLLKVRMFDENGETVEQVAFTDLQLNAKVDPEMVRSSFPPRPPDWQVHQAASARGARQSTGWEVKALPPGFSKVVEGFRRMAPRREPVAHLVFTDGLAAVSVFVEPMPATPQPLGASQQGSINVYKRQLDAHLVTVLGETPGPAVRQIADSVARSR